MIDLKRIQVGEFNIQNSVTIEEIEKNKEKNFIPFEELFKNRQIIVLDDRKWKLFLNGVRLTTNNLKDDIYRIYNNKKFIGIGIIKDNLLKRDIIL